MKHKYNQVGTTVSELRKALEAYPPDTEVVVGTWSHPVLSIQHKQRKINGERYGLVVLQDEHDVDDY